MIGTGVYYLIGGAGYKNFGDELMVKGWIDFFNHHLPQKSFVVDGASAENLIETFPDALGQMQATSFVNDLALAEQTKDFWTNVQRGYTFYDRRGWPQETFLAQAAAQLEAAEVIHLHGGGYLNIHFPLKGFLLGIAAATARRTGARLLATGIGFMPNFLPKDEDRALFEEIFSSFAAFETRDVESFELLSQNFSGNFTLGHDDTFLTQLSYLNDGQKRLHLSWFDNKVNSAAHACVLDYLVRRNGQYDEIVFWHCAPNDGKALASFQALLPNMRVLSFDEMIHAPLPVSPQDHVLTTRFHPHLILARGGARGFFVQDGMYYSVKHGANVLLGSGFEAIDPNTPLTTARFKELRNTLAEGAAEIIAQKNAFCRMIYNV